MRVYLASRSDRHAELRDVREDLQRQGHTVTSRWISALDGTGPSLVSTDVLNTDPDSLAWIALRDCEDVAASDVVISFTGGAGRGGRHVEFGIGLALGKQLIVVGPREHVFHTIDQYASWDACRAYFEKPGRDVPDDSESTP